MRKDLNIPIAACKQHVQLLADYLRATLLAQSLVELGYVMADFTAQEGSCSFNWVLSKGER
jgi:hypothetical protein